MKNRLTLKSETLAELTPADMRAVVGGALTGKKTECLWLILDPILNPPSNTHMCSADGCF